MPSLRRRMVSIPALFVGAAFLVIALPLWLPLAILADVLRGRFRLPLARLGLFGLGWAWLESLGVLIAGGLWLIGRRKDLSAHYRLQTWWAASVLRVMRATTGISIRADDVEALGPGPTVMMCRHASLADSLVSAWVITTLAGMRPRYVLKRELLADPCLDVVGNRLPNHFLDRSARDSAVELAALTRLSAGMGVGDIAVIFPEGTRASPAKREAAFGKLGEVDSERAARLRPLRHLLPPRPAGASALVAGAPSATLVVAWHVGFDGLDTFGGIIRAISHPPRPVVFQSRRVPAEELAATDGFARWLDDAWLDADDRVHQLLKEDH